MKIKHFFTAVILMASAILPSAAKVQTPAGIPWYDNKFSMFIHFGLYSHLGGVWNGKEITYGYSEQIQSHAGIYGDVYADVAREFNPSDFDADAIVALAKEAGMRSIVITSKHHDGFCLFKTATTDFNSFDATPSHRDFIAEMSEACRKGGLGFGLYFSLIDWHSPCSAHISSHNADFITAEHHKLNLAQVTELVTNYGDITELWFDMGSLSPEQSEELYNLVRAHQPDCMISGRLGNGYYDFAVMDDNFYPERSLQTPWQSAASMFNETWGYRSWQKRGDPQAKAREKLCSLIRVVAGGGNFLLNIGPEGDGSVVPFEKEVLSIMGEWLRKNADAIYSTKPSPFRAPFEWGAVTRNGAVLNLILSGKRPESGRIEIPLSGHAIKGISGPASAKLRKGMLTVYLSPESYEGDIKVVRIALDKEVMPEESVALNEKIALGSYFCQDYYTNSRSEVEYSWNIRPAKTLNALCFSYLPSDIGKRAEVVVDGVAYQIVLGDEGIIPAGSAEIKVLSRRYAQIDKASFGTSQEIGEEIPECKGAQWISDYSGGMVLPSNPFESAYVAANIWSAADQEVVLDVAAGNGIQVYVNGKSVMKHLNPYRCTLREEKVRASLHEGENSVVLLSYNRFEKTMPWMLKVSEDQTLRTYTLVLDKALAPGKTHKISVRNLDAASPHQDCELHNLQLITK